MDSMASISYPRGTAKADNVPKLLGHLITSTPELPGVGVGKLPAGDIREGNFPAKSKSIARLWSQPAARNLTHASISGRKVFVLGRDQITHLKDNDSDGVFDIYACASNAFMQTLHTRHKNAILRRGHPRTGHHPYRPFHEIPEIAIRTARSAG